MSRSTKNICQFLASKKIDSLKINHSYTIDEIKQFLTFTNTEIYNEFKKYYFKPKEPSKPFILFYNQYMNQLSDNDKLLGEDALSSKIDAIWKNMLLEEKEVFNKKYQLLLNDYNDKKRTWNEYKIGKRKIIVKITNT